MGYRLSTPINVMLFEARKVPLKLRFNLLTRKYLIKCFSRDFNPVTESLYFLKLAALGNARRINLLISFPILKHFICLFHYRNTIHCSPFLLFHFLDFDVSLFAACPCFAMFPADRNLSHSEIRNLSLKNPQNIGKTLFPFTQMAPSSTGTHHLVRRSFPRILIFAFYTNFLQRFQSSPLRPGLFCKLLMLFLISIVLNL